MSRLVHSSGRGIQKSSARKQISQAARAAIEDLEGRRLFSGVIDSPFVLNPATIPEGFTVNQDIAGFSDTVADPIGQYSATIDWGDGATTNGSVSFKDGIYWVAGFHQYTKPGNFPVQVTIFDGPVGGSNTSTKTSTGGPLTLTPVNDAPIANDDTLAKAYEDAPAINIRASDLLANDAAGPAGESDEDAQSIQITGVRFPVGGTVSLENGIVTFKPTPGFVGTASFQYSIIDNGQTNGTNDFKADNANAYIYIAPVNDAPVANSDNLGTAGEGVTFTVPTSLLISNDNAGPGESDQTITITAVGNAFGGTVSLFQNLVTFTPTPDYFGPAGFTYTLSDNGQTDGVNDFKTDAGSVTFTIAPRNNAPKANDDSLAGTDEDTPYEIAFIDLISNDSAGPANEANQKLGITSVSNAVGGTVAIVNGKIVFTPTAHYNGPASFDYTITDNGATGSVADPKSDTGTATFNINAVNDAPTDIVLSNARVAENLPAGTVVGTLAATDIDSDAFSYTLVDGDGSAGNAAFTIVGNELKTAASFDFEAQASYSIRVRVSDGAGGTFEKVLTISVTDVYENRDPVANDDTAATKPSTAVTANVLANDTDADGDALSIAQILTGPANGTAVISGNKIVYTPNTGFSGTDAITYQISDGQGGFATAVLRLTIGSGVGVGNDPVTPSLKDLDIVGTSGADNIYVQYAGAQGKANVYFNNKLQGTYSFTGRILVNGLGGNDTIKIDTAITRQAIIRGGSGNDTIYGGSGNDILLGEIGRDSLFGQNGRDILIGGQDADTLVGGDGDDVLTGGSTAYDNNFGGLVKLQNEWSRTDATYATRVSNLRNGGGLNGSFKLDKTTVTSAGNPADVLTGNTGTDLFYAKAKKGTVAGDVIKDKASAETVIDL